MGRVLCGLLKPDSGEAILDGIRSTRLPSGRREPAEQAQCGISRHTTSANPRFRVKDIIGEA